MPSIEPHDELKDHLFKQHGLSSLRQVNILHFSNSPTSETQALLQDQCPESREPHCPEGCAETEEGMNRIQAALFLALAQAPGVM